MTDLIAGIDLGTSTSAIGYFAEVRGRTFGRVDLVQDALGFSWFPSAVLYDHLEGKWVVGRPALHMSKGPGRAPYLILSAKRQLGEERTLSLNGSPTVTIAGEPVEVTPQLVLAEVLRHMKRRTEARSPDFHLRRVVVAIPMVYMSHEASLTREAVELAGLELADFIQEPTAAALYYVHDNTDMNTLRAGERILVFDLGGGTFDITVFQLVDRAGGEMVLDVLATEGVRRLGGDDASELILRHLIARGMVLPEPLPDDLRQALLEEIEGDIKVPLSNADDPGYGTYFSIGHGAFEYGRDVTRTEFVQLLEESPFAAQLRAACERVKAKVGEVNRVMMVGGSSQLPIGRSILQEIFGSRIKVNAAFNVQEAVVRGAVYRAAHLEGRRTGRSRVTLRNHGVLSHDFGVLVGEPGRERFRVLIPKTTPYPMAEPLERRFGVSASADGAAEPLVIACAQGDAAAPFSRTEPAHRIFATIDHGPIPAGTGVVVRFQANEFGEIVFSSTWAGGEQKPLALRPAFAAAP